MGSVLTAGDVRKGLKLEIDGDPYVIVDFSFTKPGKGQALYRCRLRNMINGTQFDRTYRSGDKFTEADLQDQEMEFLYREGKQYCFMNTSTYEQVSLDLERHQRGAEESARECRCNAAHYKQVTRTHDEGRDE